MLGVDAWFVFKRSVLAPFAAANRIPCGLLVACASDRVVGLATAHLGGVALGALEVRAARAVVWGSHRSSPFSRRAAVVLVVMNGPFALQVQQGTPCR